MRMRGKTGILTLLALTAGGIGAGPGEAASEKTFQLELTGDKGARFSGDCTLSNTDGDTVIPLDGVVPYREELVGRGLACKLQTEGRVVVDIEHGGSRSHSATNGGTVNISLK